MIAPCKECTSRFSGCHSFCEGYKQYRAELDIQNEEIRKKKYNENVATQFSIESKQRMKKSIHRHNY